MKKTVLIISAFIGCLAILIGCLPATWFLSSLNMVIAPRAALTGIQGTIWNGQAYFTAPSLQLETPVQWHVQWPHQAGIEWHIFVYDHKQLSIELSTSHLMIKLDPLELPASLVLSGQKDKGKVTGLLFWSGYYDLATQAGEGELRYRDITLEDGTHSISLGQGGTHWACHLIVECTMHFDSSPPLQLEGELTIHHGVAKGEGKLQPTDAMLAYAIQTSPPSLFDPVKLTAFSSPPPINNTIASNATWNWLLPPLKLSF
jgi:hypothetical protein